MIRAFIRRAEKDPFAVTAWAIFTTAIIFVANEELASRQTTERFRSAAAVVKQKQDDLEKSLNLIKIHDDAVKKAGDLLLTVEKNGIPISEEITDKSQKVSDELSTAQSKIDGFYFRDEAHRTLQSNLSKGIDEVNTKFVDLIQFTIANSSPEYTDEERLPPFNKSDVNKAINSARSRTSVNDAIVKESANDLNQAVREYNAELSFERSKSYLRIISWTYIGGFAGFWLMRWGRFRQRRGSRRRRFEANQQPASDAVSVLDNPGTENHKPSA